MRHGIFAIVLGLALTGCADVNTAGFSGGSSSLLGGAKKTTAPQEALTRVNLTRSEVIVEAPRGFCVESQHPRKGRALFANCAKITGSKSQPQPAMEALVSVSVARMKPDDADLFRDTKTLKAYLESPEGRATLSRDGEAETVEILETEVTERAVYIRLRDRSSARSQALSSDYWRAVFAAPKAVVSITAYGLEKGQLQSVDGLSLVQKFVSRTSSGLDADS